MSTPPRDALSLGIAIGTTQWVLRLNEELLIRIVRPCIIPHQICVCIRMPSGGGIHQPTQQQNNPVIQRRMQIKLHGLFRDEPVDRSEIKVEVSSFGSSV